MISQDQTIIQRSFNKATKIFILCGQGLSEIPKESSKDFPSRAAYNENPEKSNVYLLEYKRLVNQTGPCDSHYNLKLLIDKIKNLGKEVLICTQNIDDFEKKVGLDVIQVHGSISNFDFKTGKGIYLKGDLLDKNIMDCVFEDFSKRDLLLMIGTTGEGMPWFRMPNFFHKQGLPFIYINKGEETKASQYATIQLRKNVSEGILEIISALNGILHDKIFSPSS